MRTVSVVHNVFKTENNALYIIPVYKESKKKAVSQEKLRLTAFCVRFGHNVVLTIMHLPATLIVRRAVMLLAYSNEPVRNFIKQSL